MSRIFSLLALTATLASAGAVGAADPPNIILIIGDDHGWPYYGFQPSPQLLTNGQNVQTVVQTPNLDTLVATGLTFERGYATDSICAPSLQTLLSAHGHEWSQWLDLVDHVRDIVPLSSQDRRERRENRYADNLPRTLGRAGYQTWEGGKLWAGLLSDAGFDDGLATYLHPAPFYGSGGWRFGRDDWNLSDCGSTASTSTPCPALDPFRDFLDGVAGQPFFAWFAPQLPHTPYDAPQAYRDDFEALGLASYEVDHLSNIRWFDEVLGELLLELGERSLREDTLLIYVSDNGWGIGFQLFGGFGRGKGTLYDLGFRTPFIFNQPGTIAAGVSHDDFVSFSDLPATILDYAGTATPEPNMGQSLRARIEGGPAIGRTGLPMFARNVGGAYVDDQWRYLQFDDGREELYRIDLDPFEQTDLAAQNPSLVAQYAALVDARRTELATPSPIVEVSGQIQNAAGDGIAGGVVRLSGDGSKAMALSGNEGWFHFDGADATANLKLRRSKGLRFAFLDGPIPVPLERPFERPGLFVPVISEENAPIAGPFGATISGIAKTPGGVPIANAKVKLKATLPGRNLGLATRSQADGSYRFVNLVPATNYRLLARAKRHRGTDIRDLVIAAPTEDLDVDLVLVPR